MKATKIPGSASTAWMYRGHVIRRMCARSWQARLNNGTGWGNGDLLTICASKRRAMEIVDQQVAP